MRNMFFGGEWQGGQYLCTRMFVSFAIQGTLNPFNPNPPNSHFKKKISDIHGYLV